tara:strand:+ start:773 stop:1177 length:405 start_codon:yes stop_codon:yes gene_type:complete
MSPFDPPEGDAVETVLAPVALVPTVTVLTVVPVKAPPLILTALEFCVDIVPRLPVAAVIAVPTKAVEATCVLDVPALAVGVLGVPVNVGPSRSALDEIAAEIETYSASISEPLIILFTSPVTNPSFNVKFVAFV